MRGYRQRRLSQLTAASLTRYVPAYSLAELHASLGQGEQALAWLRKAYGERGGGITFIKVSPVFDGLRSDPRFQDLLRRVGLPQ